jgi:hypothetical protein
VYVLLADDRDKADLALARAGEQPHFRADFDADLGLTTGAPVPDQPAGAGNVVALADWVRQANQHMK